MSKEIILEVSKFVLSYEPIYYRARTVRDAFVDFLKNPLDNFLSLPDRLVVLEELNFNIYAGDRIGIMGTNGVGKTSLCRYLGGIIPSEAIKIKADTRVIFDNNASLFPDLTGRENAELMIDLVYENLTSKEKTKLLSEIIEFSELHEMIDTPFKNYSRGMKSRLYLSLLTAKESGLIIVDEALGGLDHFFFQKMEKRLHDVMLRSKAGVIVSHNIEEILSICNRVIILDGKKIVFDGDPRLGVKHYLQSKL